MDKENIMFFFSDKDETKNEVDINELINDFNLINSNETCIENNNNKLLDYLTVNELHKICEYYDLLKNIKIAKYKKSEIINAIQMFEMNESNKYIVEQRIKMWKYINELMSDKIMKKYIIWN